jgi:hypothetical protein
MQRRKTRIITAIAILAGLPLGALAATAAADNSIPANTNWGKDRTFANRYEFELVCDEIGGSVGRYTVWDKDTLYCEKNPVHGSPDWWYYIPFAGLVGGEHWFTYDGPDAVSDWNDCGGCGGGGSW